jgi:hypothetical protein
MERAETIPGVPLQRLLDMGGPMFTKGLRLPAHAIMTGDHAETLYPEVKARVDRFVKRLKMELERAKFDPKRDLDFSFYSNLFGQDDPFSMADFAVVNEYQRVAIHCGVKPNMRSQFREIMGYLKEAGYDTCISGGSEGTVITLRIPFDEFDEKTGLVFEDVVEMVQTVDGGWVVERTVDECAQEMGRVLEDDGWQGKPDPYK